MLLFWNPRLHTSALGLVISRRLHAAHSRPPGAPAAPVSADSVPYQQSLHPEIQHPETDAHSSGQRAPTPPLQKWLRPQSVSFTLIIRYFVCLFFLDLFFSEIAASQVWGCCQAVATPMAQKDAEGWWEGAAKLLCKSLVKKMKLQKWSNIFSLNPI